MLTNAISFPLPLSDQDTHQMWPSRRTQHLSDSDSDLFPAVGDVLAVWNLPKREALLQLNTLALCDARINKFGRLTVELKWYSPSFL